MSGKKIKKYTEFMLDNKKEMVEFDENDECVFCGTKKEDHWKINHKCWI